MLYLLDKDVRTVKWNGIPLHEASSAIVKEEVNGDFVLTVRYPITDSSIYQLIKEDMLIKAPAPVLGAQLFRIKKPVENDDSLDITAYHISDDVMQRSINPVNVVGQSCAMALSQMVQNAKTDLGNFSFTSDIMDSRTFNTTETGTLYSVLLDGKHSIVGTWEGELVRDNFALTIKRSRGADRGVVITTHKNLKSYQRTKNSQSVVTRIHAKSTFKAEGAEEETTITVTVDSPLIGNYPYINEKDYENNNAKTVDELRKWAEAKFKNEGIDKISDAIEIEAYELDGQVIHLGDTVNIKSKKHDVDLYKKAIAYEYNALTEEYISITFDDKPGVGGSGVSSGVSNAADVILGVNANAQEVAVERAIRNANQAFDAEFNKRVESINDGIEQAKAEAELYADNIRQSIDADINAVNQSMQAQSEEHDRQVANILSKTQSVESLANQAKTDAASAIARANQVKTEAIADARAQVATVNQALNTAKTELQSAIASADQKARDSQASATALRNDLNLQASKILEQARAQTALTNRVTSVETLADGTRSTVAELSKIVNKATGDIASVTSRTKTVEDNLNQTRTQYEALTQTVNAQTGQIDSINRKTADLQSGIDGVNNRFETIWASENNLLSNTETLSTYSPLAFPTNNYLGRAIKRITKSANSSVLAEGLVMQTHETLVNPKEMILSFHVKANRDARIRCFMYNPNASKDVVTSEGYTAKRSVDGMAVLNVTTSWQRVWIKWTYLVNYSAKPWVIIGRIVESYDTDVTVDISAPALYHGHHNKEWSPAGLDFKNELATYVQNAQESSADLARRIETADGKAVDAKAYAQQTADGFNTRIESLESYKNAEGTRATQYLTASRTETAKQLTAERTAISTNYVAKSTYDENVRGTTLKLNEIKTTADTAKQNLATYQNTVDRKLTELTTSTQTLDRKISTASTKVDTVAGQIRTEISNVETKIPTSIGGRNLFKGSRDFSGVWYNAGNGSFFEEYKDVHIHRTKTAWLGKSQRISVKSGEIYTFSFYAKSDSENDGIMFYLSHSETGTPAQGHPNNKYIGISTDYQRYSITIKIASDGIIVPRLERTNTTSFLFFGGFKLEIGSISTDWSPAPEDVFDELSSVKTTINQTASGVEQLSTSLTTTDSKVTTAEAKIRNLVNEVSSKVSQTDYNTLTGRVDDAETAITQNAQEISKRLTSTQVESAITGKGYQTASQVNTAITSKGYQTKSDVDSNITGRGYITNSALQPYALSTTVQNLVKETADSFSRTISETKALIPSELSGNLLLKSNVGWSNVHDKNYVLADKLEKGKTYTLVAKYWHGQGATALTSTIGDGAWNRLSYNPAIDSWMVTFQAKADILAGQQVYLASSPSTALGSSTFVTLVKGTVPLSRWEPAYSELATVTALHNVTDTVDSHTRTIGAVGETGSILDNVSKVTQTATGLVQEVSGTNGLKTQVSTLAGSYAVKNLNNSGDILSQANLSSAQFLLEAAKIRLKGKTLADEIQAIDGKFGTLFVADGTFAKLNATVIGSQAITADKLKVDQAFFDKLMANDAYLKQLFAKSAFITQVQAVTLSASKISGGILTAINKAMEVNLNAGQILYYTDQAALKRILNGYPTQFVKFATGTVTGKGNAGVTVIGSNRWNSESSNDGGFVGIRAWNGANIDQIDVVGDTVRLASSTFDSADGWTVNTLPGKLDIDAFNTSDRPSSRLSIGDVKLFRTSTSYVSLMDILHQFNHNFKHLQNITGRGDVILTWDTIK
ncbi:phage tail spike protein [Streptococcus suis]|uniref:phage tail spike protein n=1 Tax=Streptococcus suis TaxID=1307 RepID=UPI002AB50037|nr:phage tail spike protein [Streptococcus suis]MDY7602293.1 phage tail spike protein [Streptococcus suis]